MSATAEIYRKGVAQSEDMPFADAEHGSCLLAVAVVFGERFEQILAFDVLEARFAANGHVLHLQTPQMMKENNGAARG
jgi:hypothetical protein